MDKADGQDARRTAGSTRERILLAAAELIGEQGWSAVTTRGIAERAGVPHGAVSYHFAGKAELLREAALAGSEQALAAPVAIARGAGNLGEVVAATLAWFGSGELGGAGLDLMLETARQAGRDERLRLPLAAGIADYRNALTGLVRADQRNGVITPELPADGLAALVAALFDGLILHLMLDPAVDVDAIGDALRRLLGRDR
jgi:AcrR family transcriptional regulator